MIDVVARCRELAQISEEPDRLTRPFASPAMARANELVAGWMREAGAARTRVDTAGNLVGSWPGGGGPGAGTLLIGSHLDTVRDAGAFDGPLGVLVGIAAMERLARAGVALPFDVDVLGFSDEEGLRYGTAYLGSSAVAGTFDPALLALCDDAGVSVADALRTFGGDPDAIARASRRGQRLLGYLEVHMEQGPVLEQVGRPVGVVSAISGASRLACAFRGVAGHAGTVPMRLRRDALTAAAEWMVFVERHARSCDGLVATVGRIEARPGAPNTVPGEVLATLDVRHADDDVRTRAVGALIAEAARIGVRREVEVAFEMRMATSSVAVDPGLASLLRDAVAARGVEPLELPSGAGHDAVTMSALTGVAMLFVRCAGGVSHTPAEHVSDADAGVAVDVVCEVLRRMAA